MRSLLQRPPPFPGEHPRSYSNCCEGHCADWLLPSALLSLRETGVGASCPSEFPRLCRRDGTCLLADQWSTLVSAALAPCSSRNRHRSRRRWPPSSSPSPQSEAAECAELQVRAQGERLQPPRAEPSRSCCAACTRSRVIRQTKARSGSFHGAAAVGHIEVVRCARFCSGRARTSACCRRRATRWPSTGRAAGPAGCSPCFRCRGGCSRCGSAFGARASTRCAGCSCSLSV